MSFIHRAIKAPLDVIITLICWLYFLLGYLIFYLPILIVLIPFTSDREFLFQRINHIFYKTFFIILTIITPGLSLDVSPEVKQITSAVVIANHRSYLDPILLISIFPRHKTIVKGIFFNIPIMRWIMKSGGYIPFARSNKSGYTMIEGIQGMSQFIKKGGVLFVFPEGRRSRDGVLAYFQKGAFSIAAQCRVPVEVLYINNTDKLFIPGKFFFNTCLRNHITVELVGRIDADDAAHSHIQARIMRDKAFQLIQDKLDAKP